MDRATKSVFSKKRNMWITRDNKRTVQSSFGCRFHPERNVKFTSTVLKFNVARLSLNSRVKIQRQKINNARQKQYILTPTVDSQVLGL
jgi:hypothetical protein